MLRHTQRQVPLHEDKIAPVPCSERGFKLQSEENDTASFGSFLSNDRLLCYEGPLATVEEALAMKKVAPQRYLFSSGVIRKGVRCKDWSYEGEVGEDNCHPGLRTYKL